jgi:hypothetical protein
MRSGFCQAQQALPQFPWGRNRKSIFLNFLPPSLLVVLEVELRALSLLDRSSTT